MFYIVKQPYHIFNSHLQDLQDYIKKQKIALPSLTQLWHNICITSKFLPVAPSFTPDRIILLTVAQKMPCCSFLLFLK